MISEIVYLWEHIEYAVINEDVPRLIKLLKYLTKRVRTLKTDEELHTYHQIFLPYFCNIDNTEYTEACNNFYYAVEDEVRRACKLGLGMYGGHPRILGHSYKIR